MIKKRFDTVEHSWYECNPFNINALWCPAHKITIIPPTNGHFPLNLNEIVMGTLQLSDIVYSVEVEIGIHNFQRTTIPMLIWTLYLQQAWATTGARDPTIWRRA